MRIITSKKICFFLIFALAWATCPSGAAQEGQGLSRDDIAWNALSVERNRFWTDVEDSPALVERSAWPLIKALKFFMQYYPNSPHVPEAYYLLGEAYASVGYNSEAAGHWRTVVRYYPSSKWAGPALTELVKQLELKGNRLKILDFYKEILRQFPDSPAALMARVLLAEDALRQGQVEIVRLTVERLEKYSSIELIVPEFLRLKAMLAEREGQHLQEREYLLHYLNLIKSRSMRATALFRIAESYRAEGQYLKARKYYALIKRDFGSEPEALFARFRLAQLEDRARGRLSVYVSSALSPEDMPATARLYSRILRELPNHPLTQEVQLEFMQLRMKQAKYLHALKLGYDFLKRMPDSVYAEKVRSISLDAIKALEEHRQTVSVLEDAVDFGVTIKKSGGRGHVLATPVVEATRTLWLKLMRQLVEEDMPEAALFQFRRYTQIYGADDNRYTADARSSALAALAAFDASLLRNGNWTGFINYHFTWKSMMDDLALPSHWYALARCWDAIECPDAALRAFYHAWNLGSGDKQKCSMLHEWADCAIRAGDHVTASSVMEFYDRDCPDEAFSPHALTLKGRIEALRGRWREAVALYRDAVREGGGLASKKGLLRALLMVGDWQTASSLRDYIWDKMKVEEQKDVLGLWGDEAFRLQDYAVARDAYERLFALDPQEVSVAWRLARAKELAGDLKASMEEFKALSQADSPLWAGASDAVLKNRKFWEGVPEELK